MSDIVSPETGKAPGQIAGRIGRGDAAPTRAAGLARTAARGTAAEEMDVAVASVAAGFADRDASVHLAERESKVAATPRSH